MEGNAIANPRRMRGLMILRSDYYYGLMLVGLTRAAAVMMAVAGPDFPAVRPYSSCPSDGLGSAAMVVAIRFGVGLLRLGRCGQGVSEKAVVAIERFRAIVSVSLRLGWCE